MAHNRAYVRRPGISSFLEVTMLSRVAWGPMSEKDSAMQTLRAVRGMTEKAM